MAKGGNENKLVYKAVNFEIFPTPGEVKTLTKISANLRGVWNEALVERRAIYDDHIAPIYLAIKGAKTEEEKTKRKAELKEAFKKHRVTLFDQINGLTAKREDPNFASVPRNWQEETLDTLDGSFKSFMELRKNGDVDAHTPDSRREERFAEISGRMGFTVRNGEFFLCFNSEQEGGFEFAFDIPRKQEEWLERAVKLRKFTLYRTPSYLSAPGRFWVSIAYSIPAPDPVVFSPDTAVYLSIGGSSVGVVWPGGEQVIDLWRPDKHWQPKIEKVRARQASLPAKGSRKWKKRNEARLKMERLKSRQQKQNHREVVARLLKLGHHFVVTDYPVRSKVGKLADGDNSDRGGLLGLNWIAQNTGSFGELVLWLTVKSREFGGSVQKHKLLLSEKVDTLGRENKIWLARQLKDSFCQ